jgi:hypothetical protein
MMLDRAMRRMLMPYHALVRALLVCDGVKLIVVRPMTRRSLMPLRGKASAKMCVMAN